MRWGGVKWKSGVEQSRVEWSGADLAEWTKK